MSRNRPCCICSKTPTVGAHVKDKSTFKPAENDRRNNIIRLCSNHHTKFDNGEIAICSSKEKFIILKKNNVKTKEASKDISHIKEKYIKFKNRHCKERLRFLLGISPSSSWAQNPCKN